MRLALAACLCLPLAAFAEAPASPSCAPLPALRAPRSFGPGESLEFTLDAMGAEAGQMTLQVLPLKDGALPVRVRAKTNTFFSKVRRVNGHGTSYLHPKTLRPARYSEDSTENEVRRTAEVTFVPKSHRAGLRYTIGGRAGQAQLPYGDEGLDVAGAIYLMRQLPLRAGMPVCFDVYGIRRMWRMSAKVEAREHVSLPLGEFEAWHLSGTAVRLDEPSVKREVHVWISDDARRLPLAAVGTMDVGAVRATLIAFTRGGQRQKAQGKEELKW